MYLWTMVCKLLTQQKDVTMAGTLTLRDMDILEKIRASYSLTNVFHAFFPRGELHKMFQTTTACLYTDVNKTHVVKVFKSSFNPNVLFDIERRAYDALDGVPNTPNMLASGAKPFGYIIMKHLGQDGLEIANTTSANINQWRQMVTTTVKTVNDIHERGLIHGDIKLENMTFDGNQWYLIDFGFACTNNDEIVGFRGTYPHVLPCLGGDPGEEVFEDVQSLRRALDWFSLALTLLSFAGVYPEEACNYCKYNDRRCSGGCEGRSHVTRIDIRKFMRVRADPAIVYGSDWERLGPLSDVIIETVCELVLTQLDNTRRYIIWQSGKCEYFGDIGTITVQLKHKNIKSAWDTLTSLVT